MLAPISSAPASSAPVLPNGPRPALLPGGAPLLRRETGAAADHAPFSLALRRAAAAGGAAVLLSAAGVLADPGHRRAARALLEDAAVAGGQVMETTAGELLLLGAGRAAAARITRLMRAVLGDAAAVSLLPLPDRSAMLLAWAATARLAAPSAPVAAVPEQLDARLSALNPWLVLRRAPLLRHRPGEPPHWMGQRLRLSRRLLAERLGLPPTETALLRHAADAIAGRLPGLLAQAAAAEQGAPQLTLLPLRRYAALDPPAASSGRVAVLPLAAAGEPTVLAARRRSLAALGWGLALEGLSAAALGVIAPTALAADLLLLRWDPALEGRVPRAALRGLDPNRLILEGAADGAALAWAAALGIERVVPAQAAPRTPPLRAA